MTTGISIAIPLGFLLLGGALCWFIADTKGRWPLKVLLTGFLAFYSLETITALKSYKGWPADERMPQRSLLISASLREPNPPKNDPGAIFLWVIPLGMDDPSPFAYDPISGEPRAYRIPYSKQMRDQVAAAMKAMQENGRPILIERDGTGDADGDGTGNPTGYDDDNTGLRMRELPPPALPPKSAR